MEWISITERYPSHEYECKYDWVLVAVRTDDYDALSIAYWNGKQWLFLGDQSLAVYSCVPEVPATSKQITHWMPLPRLPF